MSRNLFKVVRALLTFVGLILLCRLHFEGSLWQNGIALDGLAQSAAAFSLAGAMPVAHVTPAAPGSSVASSELDVLAAPNLSTTLPAPATSAAVQSRGLHSKALDGYDACDFNHSAWRSYLEAPRAGVVRLGGNSRGQGLGNLLGGVARAVQLAVASRRNLELDMALWSGVKDGAPIRGKAEAPFVSWISQGQGQGACSIRCSIFNFGSTTPFETLMAAAKNASKFPVFCLEANFGHTPQGDKLVAAMGANASNGDGKIGCALNFVLNSSKVRTRTSPHNFQLVGHLRLGDAYMKVGFKDRRRISKIFHGADRAGTGFLDCMQGVAQQWMARDGDAKEGKQKACDIVLLSDSQEAKLAAQRKINSSGPCNVSVDAINIAKHSAVGIFGQSSAMGMVRDMMSLANADVALLSKSGFGMVGADMGPVLRKAAFFIEDIVKGEEITAATDLNRLCRLKELQPADVP